MKSKPVIEKYRFDDTLLLTIPNYLHAPIGNWLYNVLVRKDLLIAADGIYNNRTRFSKNFHEILQIEMREVYPDEWNQAINFILGDSDRTLTILQWSLNYCANQSEALGLEYSLRTGGMGYAVQSLKKDASEYDDGVYDLVERVPDVVKKMAEKSFETNEELLRAWRSCYGLNPKYNEVVQVCQNVLESVLRDRYLPKDGKAQLGKLITDIRNGKTLKYKGSDIPGEPNDLLKIIQNVPGYRGLHKAGTGKDASREEAEFVMHASILIWNMHQQ